MRYVSGLDKKMSVYLRAPAAGASARHFSRPSVLLHHEVTMVSYENLQACHQYPERRVRFW